MIFEINLHRGTSLWLNGKNPQAQDWSVGEIENGQECRTGIAVDSTWLPFEELMLDKWVADVPVEEYCDGDPKPETITITTDKGEFRLQVVDMRFADQDAEYDEETDTVPANIVKLANGEDLELDETMLYIRAEG